MPCLTAQHLLASYSYHPVKNCWHCCFMCSIQSIIKPCYISHLPPYPPPNRCCLVQKPTHTIILLQPNPTLQEEKGTATIYFTIWDNEAAVDLQQWETPDVKLFFQFGVSSWCGPERVYLCHLCTLLELWLKIHIQYDPHSWNRSQIPVQSSASCKIVNRYMTIIRLTS